MLDAESPDAHVIHMSDLRSKRNWRSSLTALEKKRLSVIERDLAKLDKQLVLLRADRNRIQNRATVRAGK